MASVIAARRKHAGVRAAARKTANRDRLAKKESMDRKKAQILELFRESDVNVSSDLDGAQMKTFLEKYAYLKMGYTSMEGTVPDAEVQYVIRIVNAERASDAVSEDDIVTAVSIWETLASDQEKIKKKFDEFDKDNTGTLSPDQVAQMLKWMNGGDPVTQEEVDWVIAQADFSKEGSLRKEEINAAVAVWYTKVTEEAQKKSGVCAIL